MKSMAANKRNKVSSIHNKEKGAQDRPLGYAAGNTTYRGAVRR
jgi:hypothetical protein